MAGCGSSVSSSTQPATNDEYSMVVSPDRLTLNAGDWSTISATVDVSNLNSTARPISPQPTVKFYSSDARVTISAAGEVCAGQWDTRYLTCTPTVIPAINPSTGKPNANAGQPDLPTGYVTITAYNADRNVTGTTQLSVHQRASRITLTSPQWGSTRKCISQNDQVKYVATPVDANGNTIGNVFDNDYTWVVGDTKVASVSTTGFVVARNPGVTSVYAKLNGTISVPMGFATCPPAAIVLASSPYTNSTPVGPYSTADLNSLNKGDQKYLTATLVDSTGKALPLLDTNGNALTTLPLDFISSDILTGAVSSVIPLTSRLTLETSGRFSVMAACEPSTCNASVPDFTLPAPVGTVSGKQAGFGYPIYSNVIGVSVGGTTGSTVLVTNSAASASSATPAHRLLAYDSESLTVTHTVALANLPNSLVIAPNGNTAYMGSDDGLMVVNLQNFQASIQNYPVAGGQSTDMVTGKVLGVSPDSRYVLLSDPANGLVFLIDTTGTKVAARYTFPNENINAVTFAPDGSNFWIAGDKGIYTFYADTFVLTNTTSTPVKALAWTPDGQSYFASSGVVTDYSTCDDKKLQTLNGSPLQLSATVMSGISHIVGLSGSQWYDYSVASSSQVSNGSPLGSGFVCAASVNVSAPAITQSTSQCSATQTSFSPILQREFITGVDPQCANAESVIHGYDVGNSTEVTLSTAAPVVPLSGGLLNDGRKLFIGTYDSTTRKAVLHRIDLASGTEDVVTDPTSKLVTIPASVDLIPSFVAVVPK